MMKFIYRASARASLCAVLFLSAAGAFGASTYYVATTGDDGAAGTADAPWATVTHAIATASAGDVIHVGEGTWTWSGKVEKGFTIEGEGDATILKTTAAVTFNAADLVVKNCRLGKNAGANYCSYTLTSGTISNCWFNGCSPQSTTLCTVFSASGGLITDCRVSGNSGGIRNGGIGVCEASGNAVIRNTAFFGNRAAANDTSYLAGGAGALTAHPASGQTVTIENCTFSKNSGHLTGGLAVCNWANNAIGKLAGTVIVRNCVFANNLVWQDADADSQGRGSDDLYVWADASKVTFEDCHIKAQPSELASLATLTDCSGGFDAGFADEQAQDFAPSAGSPVAGIGYHALAQGDAFACAVETPAKNRAIAALPVTLKALVFNAPSGGATYAWDLDGDGTYETTDRGASFDHVFTTPGWNRVGVKVTVGGETAEQPAANLVYVAPSEIYVAAYVKKTGVGSNVFPYDTMENAATTLSAAWAAALPGSKIVVGDTGSSGVGSDVLLKDVEVAGLDRTKAYLTGTLALYRNALVHTVKTSAGGNTSSANRFYHDTACMSNCWMNAHHYSGGGSPVGTVSKGLITHSLLTANYCNNASNGNGPVLTVSGTGALRNSVLTGNYINGSVAGSGRGIVSVSDTATIENNTFYGNYDKTDTQSSAGLYVAGGSPVIRNNILWGNEIGAASGIGTGTERNYYVAAGTPVAERNCSNEGFGTNPVTDAPDFVNPSSTTPADRNLTLKEDSPCIDKGLYRPWQKTAVDAAGNARFQGYGVDIGAYEVAKDTPALGVTADKASYYGAQDVTLTAASTNGVAMETGTTYLWAVDGVEQDETSGTFVRRFETGTYQVTATSRQCAYFTAAFELVVREVPGVDFETEETAGVGRKSVTFTPRGTGGLTIDDAATYAWYVNDAAGEGTPFSTEKTPTRVFAEPGTYDVFLRVTNADGAGLVCEKERPGCVTVEVPSTSFTVSATTGEGRLPATLTATATGFAFGPTTEYEWFWTGGASPDATGNPAEVEFRAGTWTITFIAKNVDGAGLAFTNTLENAVTVIPGADFYVSDKGDNTTGDGTKAKPFATLPKAVSLAQRGQRICISGIVRENGLVTLDGLEVYGSDPTTCGLTVLTTSSEGGLKLTNGSFVHGLKISNYRMPDGALQVTDAASVVSNCWVASCNYSTARYPGGGFSAGLVTHTLFSGNNCNYGPVVSVSGTATVRNCVFTGNSVNNGADATKTFTGIVGLSGTAVFENNTVYGNTAALCSDKVARQVCAGVYVSGGTPTVRNNIIWNNRINGSLTTGTVGNYSCKAGTPVVVNNCTEEGVGVSPVTEAPGFAALDMTKSAEQRDFSLGVGSPCIDAGLYQVWQAAATDYAGAPRFQGQNVDIGAYEFAQGTPQLGITPGKAKYSGAQDVTFTAASDNGTPMADGTTYLWTVDGIEQDETSGTLVKYLETGTYRVTATSRQCDYFTAAFELVVHEIPGVDFDSEETAGVGRKTVTFTPRGTGGLTIDDAATYAWYVNDETGAGEPVSTERTPTLEFNEPGVYGVLLKVSNADGAGAAYEKYRPGGAVVETPGVNIALSETTGEGRTLITLTATPSGFVPDEAARVEWRWTDLQSATPEQTGSPVVGTFRPGTWSVQAVIANADGAGLAVTNTIADAVTIAPGADFYVAASGDDANPGTKKSPYKSLSTALKAAEPGQKIKVLGTVSGGGTLDGVELYGDSRTTSAVSGSQLKLKNGAFMHDLKVADLRVQGGMVVMDDENSVISNCWISGGWFTTAGTPGGSFSAGLVTHTLFSRNHCNYGNVIGVSGTAKVRNCVFTANDIDDGNDPTATFRGVVGVSGKAFFENNTVYGNWATKISLGDVQKTAGIYVSDGTPTVRNNISYGNRINGDLSTGTVGNWFCEEGAEPIVANNASEEGFGEGAVTGDPKFAAPDNPAYEQRDFSLGAGSVCVDKGANVASATADGATDYVGNPRVMGWGVDIGAYEAVAKILSYDFVAAKTVVTGAQAVRFDVTGDVDEIPDGAEIVWYVDRVAQPQKGASVELDLEVGTHDIKVDMDGRFTIQKSGYVTVKPIPGCTVIISAVVGEAPKTIALRAEATGFTFSDRAVYKWFWTNDGSGEPDATVNPVVRDFGAGTYDVVFQVENADGEGASFTVRKPGAFTVYPHEEPVVPSGNGGKRVYVDQLAGISFKTVNGRPLAGTGALALTAADGYRAVEDVGDYGAVGDGRTDDTAAITAAIEAAYASGKPLYFPRTGCGSTYLTRKGLVLLDNLTITSDPGVVLANASAVLEGGGQTLSTFLLEPVAKGQTTCHVGSVACFKVGQEVTIYRDGDGSYTETLADIAAIDAERNILTIDVSPYRVSGTNEGFLNAYKAGTLVMTDFALVKSLRTKSAVNCTVENLTLRAYGNPRDPYVYSISPFHQAAVGGQRSLHLRNVTVDGSNHDGISTQGSGDIWIEGCTVKDIRHKGIHWGTTCDRLTVRNCLCLRCGSPEYEKTSNNGGTGAMYFCYNNHRMLIEGNRMVDCYKGVFGFDYRDASGGIDSDSVIVNNVFDNCTLYGFSTYAYGGSGNHLVLTGNVFTRFGGASVPIDALSLCGATVTDNVIGGFKSDWTGLADHANAAILVRSSPSLVVRGNRIEKGNIKVVGSKNTLVSGNVLDAGRVDDSSGDNENLVKVDNIEGGNK